MRAIRRPGLTLVDLLVVIAILVILAGLLFPVFATARDAATEVAAALDVPRKRAYRIAIGLD